jgi:hypothetical protein
LIAKRLPVQFVAMLSPFWYQSIHHLDEFCAVSRFDHVYEFMYNDILQAVLRLLREFGVQTDRPAPGIAATPFCFHAADENSVDARADQWPPFCENWWDGDTKLLAVKLANKSFPFGVVRILRRIQKHRPRRQFNASLRIGFNDLQKIALGPQVVALTVDIFPRLLAFLSAESGLMPFYPFEL